MCLAPDLPKLIGRVLAVGLAMALAAAPASADPAAAAAESAPVSAPSSDLAATLRTIPEIHHGNPSSPYALAAPLTHQGSDLITDQVELHAHVGAITAAWTGSAAFEQALAPSYRGVLNEAYLDRAIGGLHASIGKKVLSWDVGLGFRPLDVLQQEDRRALYTYALEGIVCLCLESFGQDSAWTVVFANPGRGTAADARNDTSGAVRYYRRIGTVDAYAVARYSARERAQFGSSMSWVGGESLEAHASLLYQRRHEVGINALTLAGRPALSHGDPITTVDRPSAWLALLGSTWTHESGLSLLAEAWFDGTSYRKADWDALRALDLRQLAALGQTGVPAAAVAANLAFSSTYYQLNNLLRENLLARASYKIDKFTPSLDVLTTPHDGGVVATVSCTYEGNRMRIDSGLRVLTGRPTSAYRLAPENRVLFLGASWFF